MSLHGLDTRDVNVFVFCVWMCFYTCYVWISKRCIVPTEWRHFDPLQRTVWESRLDIRVEVRIGCVCVCVFTRNHAKMLNIFFLSAMLRPTLCSSYFLLHLKFFLLLCSHHSGSGDTTESGWSQGNGLFGHVSLSFHGFSRDLCLFVLFHLVTSSLILCWCVLWNLWHRSSIKHVWTPCHLYSARVGKYLCLFCHLCRQTSAHLLERNNIKEKWIQIAYINDQGSWIDVSVDCLLIFRCFQKDIEHKKHMFF